MTRARVDDLRERYRGAILRRDVDLILSDLLGRPVSYVLAHGEAEADEAAFEDFARRRLAGEPLQYIRGHTEFFGRDFLVDDRVLIPRPETELLVEAAIARIPRGARVADAGTGSGCIAVSLAHARPDLRVLAIDVSVAALAVARRNGARHLVASHLFDAVRGELDAIVSNPPYIPAADVEALTTEVRDHEPRGALTPGPRGTEVIEHLFRAPLVIFEIGFGQEHDVRAIAASKGYIVEEIIPDLASIPRVVIASIAKGAPWK
jgi:release factor glutamine methyltransferase